MYSSGILAIKSDTSGISVSFAYSLKSISGIASIALFT
jgi:hypothetical protein